LKISFAEGAIGSPSEGMAAHAGRSPVGGRNSDEWLFDDGIDGVGRSYSSLVPDPQRREKMLTYNALYERPRRFGSTPSALKICTRSIVVRRTIIGHGRSKNAHRQHDMPARSEHRTDAAQKSAHAAEIRRGDLQPISASPAVQRRNNHGMSIASLNC
jgi:hypothetical protein